MNDLMFSLRSQINWLNFLINIRKNKSQMMSHRINISIEMTRPLRQFWTLLKNKSTGNKKMIIILNLKSPCSCQHQVLELCFSLTVCRLLIQNLPFKGKIWRTSTKKIYRWKKRRTLINYKTSNMEKRKDPIFVSQNFFFFWIFGLALSF